VRLLPAQVVWEVPIPLLLRGSSPLFGLPLFDAERAIREGENPPPALVLEITLGPQRRIPPGQDASPELDLGWQVPDFPPQEWEPPTGEQPPG
jgi:hypothetical protein